MESTPILTTTLKDHYWQKHYVAYISTSTTVLNVDTDGHFDHKSIRNNNNSTYLGSYLLEGRLMIFDSSVHVMHIAQAQVQRMSEERVRILITRNGFIRNKNGSS